MELEELRKQINELQKKLEAFEAKQKIDTSNWERDGIVCKSANIIVAPEDYWEPGREERGVVDGKKRYFTWDEAMGIAEKLDNGWRLPTTQEMVHLFAEFGLNERGDDVQERIMKALNLGLNGCYYDEDDYEIAGRGSRGYYWSSTACPSTNARYLFFNDTGVYPQSYNSKANGFSVRLVKRKR